MRTAYLVRDRRRELRASAAIVANELRWNADICERVERRKAGVETMAREIQVSAWEQHRAILHAFTTAGNDLWDSVGEVYRALEESKRAGVRPPSSRVLRDLSERLEGATF